MIKASKELGVPAGGTGTPVCLWDSHTPWGEGGSNQNCREHQIPMQSVNSVLRGASAALLPQVISHRPVSHHPVPDAFLVPGPICSFFFLPWSPQEPQCYTRAIPNTPQRCRVTPRPFHFSGTIEPRTTKCCHCQLASRHGAAWPSFLLAE